jgi:maltose O-acetyltransferase
MKIKLLNRIINIIKRQQPLDKLIKRGLKVGNNFQRMTNVTIDAAHCWHIEIGDNVTLAPGVHILAHDASTKIFLGFTKVANVTIGNNVFIGAHSVILPGVTIGNNVIIGAGSVVNKNIESDSVAVGNPAKIVCSLSDYLQKNKNEMSDDRIFGVEFTLKNKKMNNLQKDKLKEAAKKFGKIYVR